MPVDLDPRSCLNASQQGARTSPVSRLGLKLPRRQDDALVSFVAEVSTSGFSRTDADWTAAVAAAERDHLCAIFEGCTQRVRSREMEKSIRRQAGVRWTRSGHLGDKKQ